MSTGKKLLLGSVSRTVLMVSQVAIGFFMMPFLVKNLGNSWYGIWTVLSSIVAYFYLMDIGLGQGVQICIARYIAVRDYARANAVINTSLLIYSGISLLILAVTIILALSAEHVVGHGVDFKVVEVVLLIMGVNIALEFPFNAFAGLINAYSRFDLLSLSRFVVLMLTSGLTVYFIGHGYGIVALAVIYLVCGQISNFLFFLISKHCFREMSIGARWFDRTQAKELAHYSLWSFLSSLSNLFKYRLQAVIIIAFSGPIAVTHYVIGSRLADYFRELLFQATNLSMPALAKYHALQQAEEMHTKLRFLTKINTLLAVFGAGMIIIVGDAFISRWMGNQYPEAYPVLVVLVVAMTVEIMIDPSRVAMSAMGNVKFVGILEFLEAVFNVALSIVLIRSYGLIGIAYGTLIPLLLLKLFVVPRVLAGHIRLPTSSLYGAMLPSAFSVGLYLLAFGWLVHRYVALDSYLAIALTGLAALPVFAVIAFLMFNKREMAIFMRLLPARWAAQVPS